MSDDAPSPQPLSRKGRGASIVPRPPAGEGQAARSDARERGRRIAKLRTHAKTMRSAPTPAEHRLWQILRAHRFADYKFRRQVPIDHYIADFLCPAERLIIELDGGQHAANSHDTLRDAYLQAQGFRILRFWNNDALSNPAGVFDAISAALSHPSPSHRCAAGPSLSPTGRGAGEDTHG